jgi:hypothetical protein
MCGLERLIDCFFLNFFLSYWCISCPIISHWEPPHIASQIHLSASTVVLESVCALSVDRYPICVDLSYPNLGLADSFR